MTITFLVPLRHLDRQRYHLTIFTGNLKCACFHWVDMGFLIYNSTRSGFCESNPIRSRFCQSDPIRSGPILVLSTAPWSSWNVDCAKNWLEPWQIFCLELEQGAKAVHEKVGLNGKKRNNNLSFVPEKGIYFYAVWYGAAIKYWISRRDDWTLMLKALSNWSHCTDVHEWVALNHTTDV